MYIVRFEIRGTESGPPSFLYAVLEKEVVLPQEPRTGDVLDLEGIGERKIEHCLLQENGQFAKAVLFQYYSEGYEEKQEESGKDGFAKKFCDTLISAGFRKVSN